MRWYQHGQGWQWIVGIWFVPTLMLSVDGVDRIFDAMQAEMQRAMERLVLPESERPYYIEYTIRTGHEYRVVAQYGALRKVEADPYAVLTVAVRVGSYQFDNTNFIDVGLRFFGSSDEEEPFRNRALPQELQYWQLRRELWLATDAAYKQAAEAYSKKVAALQNRVQRDTIPDFLPMPPADLVDTVTYPPLDTAYYVQLTRSLSQYFAKYPFILRDQVLVEYLPRTVYYLNSEGRRMIKTELYCGLEIVLYARSADGMPVVQTYAAYGFQPSELPSADSLNRVAEQLVQTLRQFRQAETIEVYNGPVLFEGQAAAELFAYGFLPHLVAQRPWISDQGTTQPIPYDAFQHKVGGRVLPEFLSLDVRTPFLYYRHIPCVGSYRFDDQAVPAEAMRIVDRGYLKTLFSSRVPTRRIRRSNGHYRGGAPMYSTLQLVVHQPERQKDWNGLKQRLLELVAMRQLPYGLIVRKVLNQNLLVTTVLPLTASEFPFSRSEDMVPLLEVYKVFPDGTEEPVRGVELAQLVPYLFKDIIAVGDQEYVHNFLAPAVVSPFLTGGRSYLPATMIIPAVLIEEAEVRRVEEDYSRAPLLPPPTAD